MALSDLFVNVYTLPDNGYGFVQLIFLMLVYGYILFTAANLISDGSEYLLLIPSVSGVVGSIVLPVLGAVPDAAIVVFSGLGSDAQYQMEVGIGAMAGSTILLLTVPWCMTIIAGRVNIDEEGKAVYKNPKLTPPDNFNLFRTGVVVSSSAKFSAFVVLLTSVSYWFIEGAALGYRNDSDDQLITAQIPYAATAFTLAMIFFIAYLMMSYLNDDPDSRDKILADGLKDGKLTLIAVVAGIMESVGYDPSVPESASDVAIETTENVLAKYLKRYAPAKITAMSEPRADGRGPKETEVRRRLDSILRPAFHKYDVDKSGGLDVDEVTFVLNDLGEKISTERLGRLFAKIDTDKSLRIEYAEFVHFCIEYTKRHDELREQALAEAKQHFETSAKENGDEDDEGEEVPEDLMSLSYEEQQKRIWFRACWRMLLGTILVVLFSDPMVDCFTALGMRINISPYYVSFVLGPLASNASEVVAAYNYASKKTTSTISVSQETLLGAAIMNNSLVFGCFMVVVFTQGLYYTFFSETVTIIIVELVVCGYVLLKKSHTIFDGFVILSLYPLSIVLVYLLDLIGWG